MEFGCLVSCLHNGGVAMEKSYMDLFKKLLTEYMTWHEGTNIKGLMYYGIASRIGFVFTSNFKFHMNVKFVSTLAQHYIYLQWFHPCYTGV